MGVAMHHGWAGAVGEGADGGDGGGDGGSDATAPGSPPADGPLPSPRGGEDGLLLRVQARLADEVTGALTAAAAAGSTEARSAALTDLLSNLLAPLDAAVCTRLAAHGALPPGATLYAHLLAPFFATAATGASPSSSTAVAAAAVAAVQPAFARLWSHELFPPAFALLFHRWVLARVAGDASGPAPEAGNQVIVLANGANRGFWHDVLTGGTAHAAMFHAILAAGCDGVTLVRLPPRLRAELVEVIARFFLYYQPPSTLLPALAALPHPTASSPADAASEVASVSDGASSLGGRSSRVASVAADGDGDDALVRNLALFVNELCRHLRGVRAEAALLVYLGRVAPALSGALLDVHTANRLQGALSALATPGGPLYPTRRVRHAAQQAMDALFPVRSIVCVRVVAWRMVTLARLHVLTPSPHLQVGRVARRCVHICCRLLHPLTWPPSLVHWVRQQAGAACCCCCRPRACCCAPAVGALAAVQRVICCSRPAPAPAPTPVPVAAAGDGGGGLDDDAMPLGEYITSSYSVSVLIDRANRWFTALTNALPGGGGGGGGGGGSWLARIGPAEAAPVPTTPPPTIDTPPPLSGASASGSTTATAPANAEQLRRRHV